MQEEDASKSEALETFVENQDVTMISFHLAMSAPRLVKAKPR